MLIKKNTSGLIVKSGGKIVANNEENALQIVGVNQFAFKVASSGSFRVYWGDGSYNDYNTNSNTLTVVKNYSSVGTYNILFTNTQNITKLYLTDYNSGQAVNNTNISWIQQFTNLQYLQINWYKLIGDIGNSLENLTHLTYLDISANSFTLNNASVCKSFWKRATTIVIGLNVGSPNDIDLNLDAVKIDITTNSGDVSGIIKNGYNSLISLDLKLGGSSFPTNLGSFDNWVIPDTLTNLVLWAMYNCGTLTAFNFKNLKNIYWGVVSFSNIDTTSNTSFDTFAANCTGFAISLYTNNPTKLNLSKFTSPYLSGNFAMGGANTSCGDITNIAAVQGNTESTSLYLIGQGDSGIYGTVTSAFSKNYLFLQDVAVTISATDIVALALKTQLSLYNLPNCTGNISNCNFAIYNPAYALTLTKMQNLTADITTFTFGSWLTTSNNYGVDFSNNPHFTGNIVNFPLWVGKAYVILNNCAYTGIPGFIQKIFTNRNTCLKAAGGMTTINVSGNVDNSSLTGVSQQPSLGTYSGNINNLTETQIDNLAAGLDYTGTGTSIPWTQKEKIWFMSRCLNSSTDSSLRYRASFSY